MRSTCCSLASALLSFLACTTTFVAAHDARTASGDAHLFFPQRNSSAGQNCAPIPPSLHANLTADELETLQHICWDPAALHQPLTSVLQRSGIPAGVSCQAVEWCDSGSCTTVCARGSVAVDPWLANAVRVQAHLARSLPFCFSMLFGTHNSAITLADGYGNLDPAYQALFKYVKWASADFRDAILRTNNQWLSLTDQMKLGVRVVELDTHWVEGGLRIAHCGGLHVGPLDSIVRILNTLAKLLGHHIRWDTETMGCDPSLSSIPAWLQRPLRAALEEIKAWMEAPGNEEELVVLFFDDQLDLSQWGLAGKLREELLSVFDPSLIYTAVDLAEAGGGWPSGAAMVASGRRLVLVSVADYGAQMAPIVFPRGKKVCGWTEPPLERLRGAPDCMVASRKGAKHLFNGSLVRVSSCELVYGPLNCEFVWRGDNSPYLAEGNLRGVVDCGLNVPSPDLLTPSRAAATVWTWAPGHPYVGDQPPQKQCGVMSAADGRWRAAGCASVGSLPSACRLTGVPMNSDEQWVLGPGVPAAEKGRSCPKGSTFDVPRHPRENYRLAEMAEEAGVAAVWLPVSGPQWAVDGMPALQATAA